MNAKASEPGFDRARAMLNGHPAAEHLAALYAPSSPASARTGSSSRTSDRASTAKLRPARAPPGTSRATRFAHVHRLRALADAVVVGASTVEFDDPQLTTRLVSGKSPVRVVIDPNLRLSFDRRVFTDGAVKTLVVCAEDAGGVRASHPAELVPVPRSGSSFRREP